MTRGEAVAGVTGFTMHSHAQIALCDDAIAGAVAQVFGIASTLDASIRQGLTLGAGGSGPLAAIPTTASR
jgi:hypothetical protein